MAGTYEYAKIRRPKYAHIKGARARFRAAFLDNLGKIITGDQLSEIAALKEGERYENWHQRLSELRTDEGYTILSNRDSRELKVGEYVMESADRRETAAKRVRPTPASWAKVLERSKQTCDWVEGSSTCPLKDGDIDPVGGGTVKLTPDHNTPHALNPAADPTDPAAWRALCGRHQVMKKNYWDNVTGKLNYYAIVQSAPESAKREMYEFLRRYFESLARAIPK